ncbi:uncharacterized protein LOC130961145 [Arachis stenosperma]|uniref:uncharacterized protein LOC130961145 n=1 Tax=Arachis stenosperma TaxID=217475 RepID=UPI0025AC9905|nr:uncharacterized protein LOC130961145 [Arachis stenosperma]XP_057742841.1 uncharacterized protein LOC130961145 [Arachis stenosperma]XP_057742842.1 uncharacterized protein LOC130961145 [Arachis stenosperma]XP_057742844.1 uncharacterized protein LOC130961145 [Arachis stenosperma]XP_057742845.1 uncharacterized protein LOC130961145 [Arachis stenosperma]XP_057742846.1 uncharacterized protein LOC130961145 [Arachis stenosperma]XP_057742847.1 uncharacterized protein LOC130961145 [Arachis stenosperm
MRRREGGGSLSSKLLSSLCKSAAIVIITGCSYACDFRPFWVRHHRAKPPWKTVAVVEALVAVKSCSTAIWVTGNMAVITETTIGVIAIQYSRSSLSGIEFRVLHVEFYVCGIRHQAAALSPELPLLCSLTYLKVQVAVVAAVADCTPREKGFIDNVWVLGLTCRGKLYIQIRNLFRSSCLPGTNGYCP